ncbi:MAG: peptidoglycan DD-metalloendopeptidase family protein [Roseiflexaceae bacterium]
MTNIRALRLSHGLSLIELALLCDIPARTLAEIEYGLQRLDYESRMRLARVFDLPPEHLRAGSAPPQVVRKATWHQRAVPALAVALAGALLLSDSLLNQLPPLSAAANTRRPPAVTQPLAASSDTPRLAARQRTDLLAIPTILPAALPATPITANQPRMPSQPVPTLAPRFALAEDGPHGCPLTATTGSVVLTQGHDAGTHAPASIWGAVDLAIDGDDDGTAEPGTTQGVPIFATHAGVAHVTLGSWPGGNFVRVVDEQTGWSTAYAHLDAVFVIQGQAIPAGETLGTVGSTGMTSGPHLHYEVWHGDENVDPSGLIGCE